MPTAKPKPAPGDPQTEHTTQREAQRLQTERGVGDGRGSEPVKDRLQHD